VTAIREKWVALSQRTLSREALSRGVLSRGALCSPPNPPPPSTQKGKPVQTHRIRLQGAQIQPPAGQPFHILAITSGSGNGWNFSAEVLQKSLPCWQNLPCYVDHSPLPGLPRSVRDLAGICREPRWLPEQQGITLQLHPNGPASALLTQTGSDWLNLPEPRPPLGFSADLLFTAAEREVLEICKVYSLDLVTQPARGGVFLALPAGPTPQGEEPSMTDPLSQSAPPEPVNHQLQEGASQPPAPAPAEAFHQQMCAMLLETSLSAARLPQPLAAQIRAQYAERIFDPAELNRRITEYQQLAAALNPGVAVHGPARLSGVADSRDQLQAACDDLLGAPREANMQNLKPARLGGIRELYLTLTGDTDLHGGYHPERIQLATTADFSGLVKNSLNKIVANRWEELGRAGYNWWERIVNVEHFASLQQITGTLIGTVGSLPEVAEGAAYTELEIGDSPETASWKKYGGYIPLTLELIDRDETRKLRAYPRELAAAGLRKISALVAALFTQNSGTGPLMADGGALFNNTAVTTAGGHKNLLTTALSAAEWEVVSTAVYNQPMLVKNAAGVYGTGPRVAVNPRYLLVPRNLQLTAMKILYPSLENASSIYSENQQRGQPGDVITVPEWTDAGDWAAVCDPRIVPAIFIAERFGLMPEVFIAGDEINHAVFTNDEHRLKVRHFLAVWVNDFRPLHKSNVA